MTTVFVRKLASPHQGESLTKYLPLSSQMNAEITLVVKEIFDKAGGSSLLKESGDVYLKPNGIDGKAYCYTRPELVEAVIEYWKSAGAKNIYLFENSTQSNYTRLVFGIVGYDTVCKRTGAKPVYLDEEKTRLCHFTGKSLDTEEGYDHSTFLMPEFVASRLIDNRDKNLYISLPKLKTHSMAGVTLGVKNQWGFPSHADRGFDHNFNLPYKLIDVLGYIKPDFTLIEGVEGTIYGHYPVTALADTCVLPLRLLIGGKNVVATDIVGAKIFGLELDDIPHLKIAVDKGLSDGIKGLADITIDGDISMYTTTYPTDLYDCFPPDVRVIKGATRCCKEGCQNNPLTLLQILFLDYGGTGGWNMVMGKGHKTDVIDSLEGRVLLVGHCAITELKDRLAKRLGKKNVYMSGKCNDLAASAAAMFHLMKVNPLVFIPLPLGKSITLLSLAKLHGTTANIPSIFSRLWKTV